MSLSLKLWLYITGDTSGNHVQADSTFSLSFMVDVHLYGILWSFYLSMLSRWLAPKESISLALSLIVDVYLPGKAYWTPVSKQIPLSFNDLDSGVCLAGGAFWATKAEQILVSILYCEHSLTWQGFLLTWPQAENLPSPKQFSFSVCSWWHGVLTWQCFLGAQAQIYFPFCYCTWWWSTTYLETFWGIQHQADSLFCGFENRSRTTWQYSLPAQIKLIPLFVSVLGSKGPLHWQESESLVAYATQISFPVTFLEGKGLLTWWRFLCQGSIYLKALWALGDKHIHLFVCLWWWGPFT